MTYKFTSEKFYDHSLGLSVCFRQYNADSHCKYLHGYSLAFRFKFGCNRLDSNNWVVDFGSLKQLKKWLQDNYDHKLIICHKDSRLMDLWLDKNLEGIADVRVVDEISIEMFAEEAFTQVNKILPKQTKNNAFCYEVTCYEHSGNSATVGDYVSS